MDNKRSMRWETKVDKDKNKQKMIKKREDKAAKAREKNQKPSP